METAMNAIEQWISIAVCGAHMSGLPLNWQLRELGGELQARTATASRYRLYRLHGFEPPRPGLVRTATDGCAIELEVWRLPIEQYGRLVNKVPAPLCIGTLELADGSTVQGFLCENYAIQGAEDISAFGGWRGYLASQSPAETGPIRA
jgi:allophanate hydrolase